MNPSDDPFALLPFAVAGVIVGMGLAIGSGYGLSQQWGTVGAPSRPSAHVALEGRVEWAGWRQSAVRGGPDWYLQLRLAGDDRGFLVAASSIPAFQRRRLEEAAGRVRKQEIASLVGKRATIVVDSSFEAKSSNPTPYLSALRVEGETIVPLDERASSPAPLWQRIAFVGLLGVGVLVGVGLLGASVQHVAVCIRHGRT